MSGVVHYYSTNAYYKGPYEDVIMIQLQPREAAEALPPRPPNRATRILAGSGSARLGDTIGLLRVPCCTALNPREVGARAEVDGGMGWDGLWTSRGSGFGVRRRSAPMTCARRGSA